MHFKSEKCNSRKENKQRKKKSKDFKKRIDLHEYSKSHNAPSVQKKINETNGKDLPILQTDTADCDLKTLKTDLNPDSADKIGSQNVSTETSKTDLKSPATTSEQKKTEPNIVEEHCNLPNKSDETCSKLSDTTSEQKKNEKGQLYLNNEGRINFSKLCHTSGQIKTDSSLLEIELYKLRSTLRCELDNYVTYICCIISMIAGFYIRNRTNLFHLLLAIKTFVLSVEFLLMRTINQFRQNIPAFEIEHVANVKSNVFGPNDIDTKYIFNDSLKNELGKINTIDHLKTYNDSKVSVAVGYLSWRTGIERYRMHVVLMEYFQSALRESVRIQVQLATTNIDSPDSRIPLSVPIYMHGFIYRKDNLR